MYFGFQTILWRRKLADPKALRRALASIRRFGFSGVEFADSPRHLPSPSVISDLLAEFDLDLIGVAGGNLADKVRFIEKMQPYWAARQRSRRLPYVYVEDCDAEVAAVARDVCVALHLHYPMSVSDAYNLLDRYDGLHWLPDTAHLYISGANVPEAIFRYRNRLAAVHLKDWTSQYGRTSYRYAKGFVELGCGELEHAPDTNSGDGPSSGKTIDVLNETMKILADSAYDGWVIAELDYARASEDQSVHDCAAWFAGRGLLPEPPAANPELQDPVESQFDLKTALTRIGLFGDEHFYEHAAEYLKTFFGCDAVGIWAYHQSGKTLSELASTELDEPFGDEAFEATLAISQKSLKLDCIVDVGLLPAAQSARLEIDPSDPVICAMAEKHRLRRFVCVPVYNVYNAHQVRYFLQLLYRTDRPAPDEELARAVADHFATAAEIWLTEMSAVAAREASELVSENRGIAELLRALVRLVERRVSCEGVTIFLVEPGGHLIDRASTGIEWNSRLEDFEKRYQKEDGSITSRLFDRPLPILLRSPRKFRELNGGPEWRSRETVATVNQDTCLLAPLFDRHRRLMGVVRCRNKYKVRGQIRAFNEDDLVLIESIFQTSSPDIQILVADYQRQKALSRLFHELEQPMASTQSAIIMAEYEIKRYAPLVLREDYLGDALSWIELSNRLLKSFDFLNWEFRQPHLIREWVLPIKDIIAPAVRQVRPLLQEKGFSENRIDYGGESLVKSFPKLYIDRNMFQQVFFNLLTNAIKYANRGAKEFKVEIRADPTAESNLLFFRDWGRGIPPAWTNAIFEEGVRVAESERSYVPGRGLGLWVVRRIIDMHDGRVELTHNAGPTEFTITLPRHPSPTVARTSGR
jgi:signal transduction histidine kinase/sugar phosphate isomerase/epimerase